MANDFAVSTDGLREFRRDLKRMAPELDKQLVGESRKIVGRVTLRAAATAPRLSGRLARGYRPFVTLRGAGIRSYVPYAGVHEFGGVISPRGTPITIRRSAPVTRAVEAEADRVVESFSDAVERAADKTGWR